MYRIFQFLKFQRAPRKKIPSKKESLACKKAELKEYSTMPKTFDFIAYFDDNELESIPNDNAGEIAHREANIEIMKMHCEKYADKIYSAENRGFECCTN